MANGYQKLLGKVMNGHGLEVIRNWITTYFVRKEEGRGLSDNNYTDEEKARVAAAASKTDLEQLALRVSNVYTPKGSVETYADLLEVENPEYGWVYNVKETGKNYVWVEGEDGEPDYWDDMGGDLSDYMKFEDLEVLTDDEIEMLLGVCSTVEGFEALLKNGGEIILNSDLTLEKQFVITQDTVIDLYGHKLVGDYRGILFEVNGVTLTLKNGTVHTMRRLAQAINGGKIVIESGEYISEKSALQAVGEGSSIVVNGGEVTAREGVLLAQEGAVIEVNGGTLVSEDNFVIGTPDTAGSGGNTIMVNGGSLTGNIFSKGYNAIGVYIANNDTFIMNGGSIVANGGTGLLMRAGYVAINDGEIMAITAGNVPGWIGDKNKEMSASGIIFDEESAYPGHPGMSLIVKGGTITGADHAIEVLPGEDTPNVIVSGGTFSPAYPEA